MTEITSNQTISLPDGFLIRPASEADLDPVTELIRAVDLADLGEADFNSDELLEEWQSPDFELQNDTWVVETRDERGKKRIVGYESLYNRTGHYLLDGDGYVHPEYRGLGIGTALLRSLEARAMEHVALADPKMRVAVRNGLEAHDSAGRELHENEGYQTLRYFYRMQIQMENEPEPPQWPDGITLRTFQDGQERLAFDALEESFRDHWGFTPWNYEHWLERSVKREDFEPGLFFLAWDGKEIAGASLCRRRLEGGWVSQLGVRRPWRRSGLGMALLQHSFREFFHLGLTSVSLGVDAGSPTGATRLYERAGMSVIHEFVVYEKELRAGIKPTED